MFARAFRRRVSDNDEFVLAPNFHLQPESRSLLHIRRGEVLGNEALLTGTLRLLVRFEAIGREAMRKQEHAFRRNDFFKSLAPCQKRLLAQILSVGVKTVEECVHRLPLALLKKLKARNVLAVEDHDFSVEQQVERAEF